MASVRPQNVRCIHMSSLKIDSSFSEEIVEKRSNMKQGVNTCQGCIFFKSLCKYLSNKRVQWFWEVIEKYLDKLTPTTK